MRRCTDVEDHAGTARESSIAETSGNGGAGGTASSVSEAKRAVLAAEMKIASEERPTTAEAGKMNLSAAIEFKLPWIPPSEILPGLFLGSRHSSEGFQQLKSLGVSHVVNVCSESLPTGPDLPARSAAGYPDSQNFQSVSGVH